MLFTKGAVLFGLHKSKRALIDKRQAIVCEGQVDLITAFEAGVQNVIAPQGTAFTDRQARILKRYVEEVALCFDSDAAGENAAGKSLPKLLSVGLMVRVIGMPQGEDPDSLLPGVHRVTSLCKRWLLGTHQGSVDAAHLPAYLNEFVFRFNRRRSASRGMVFYRVLQLAAGHEPVRYVDLLASKKPRRAKRAEGGTGHPPSLERPAADRPWRTAGIQLQFTVRLSGYPGGDFRPG